MEHQITESEFVLVLCEETYNRKLYSDKKVKVWFGKQITVTAGTKITEENPCKAVLMEPEE